jgi:hypothetical protein
MVTGGVMCCWDSEMEVPEVGRIFSQLRLS